MVIQVVETGTTLLYFLRSTLFCDRAVIRCELKEMNRGVRVPSVESIWKAATVYEDELLVLYGVPFDKQEATIFKPLLLKPRPRVTQGGSA